MAERIRGLMDDRGWSQAQLARMAGVSQPTISKLVKGGRSRYITRVARALNVSVEYLESGKGEPGEPVLSPIQSWSSPEDLPSGQYALIPRRTVRVSCGNGNHVYTEEEDGPPWAFSTSWLRKVDLRQDAAALVVAKGDSMSPRINDGDDLLVDLDKTEIAAGRIYAVRCGNEVRVKRLFLRYNGDLTLSSDNPEHPSETVPRGDLEAGEVIVIGRVVWAATTL